MWQRWLVMDESLSLKDGSWNRPNSLLARYSQAAQITREFFARKEVRTRVQKLQAEVRIPCIKSCRGDRPNDFCSFHRVQNCTSVIGDELPILNPLSDNTGVQKVSNVPGLVVQRTEFDEGVSVESVSAWVSGHHLGPQGQEFFSGMTGVDQG